MKHLFDIKNDQKKSEEKRLAFEARMVKKWDIFVNDIMHSQGRNQNRGQMQHSEPLHADDAVEFTEEDFERLDENFPITLQENVPNFEWDLRKNLEFKFLLVT